MSKVTVAIVGTAGRKEDGTKMSRILFDSVLGHARAIIVDKFKLKISDVTLVSGGSSWIDHVAVRLWLDSILGSEEEEYAGLQLFLPCSVSTHQSKLVFQSNSKYGSWSNNPGAVLNGLHRDFNSKMGQGFNSFSDLFCAQSLGAEFDSHYNGFHQRNIMVGKSDYLIAYTWGESHHSPKDGGTFHTWKNSSSTHKIHIPLLSIHSTFLPNDNTHFVNSTTDEHASTSLKKRKMLK
jgi:hypothetical protein